MANRLSLLMNNYTFRALALTALLTIQSANAVQATLCVDNYPPFSYFNNDKPEGAMIDAMTLIAEEMDFELLFTPETPFARCLRMLDVGLADFMVSLMPTPERLSYMAMFPYSEPEPLRLIGRDDIDTDIATMADIAKLRIGLVNGFQYPNFFSDQNLYVVLSPTPEAGIRQIRAGRIDVLVLNETVALHLISFEKSRTTPYATTITLLELDLPRQENTNSIGISKKSKLIDRENELGLIISRMRANGVFDQLIEKHQEHRKKPSIAGQEHDKN